MPELPEVETVCRFLHAKLLEKKMIDIKVNQANLRAPVTQNINEVLKDGIVTNVRRRGKYIIWEMSNSALVIIHLGMSGKLLYFDGQTPIGKHDHVIFFLEDSSSIVYNDPRRFGLIVVINAKEEEQFFRYLGIEPLTDDFSGSTLRKLLAGKTASIKSVLMNSKIIVGIGNIYAAESLFLAGILPFRLAKDLSQEECDKLVIAIKNTLTNAINAGGSTLKDYAKPSGLPGYFQHYFKVYGRAGKPCVICKNTILSVRQSGRSTFYCSKCQNS
ncbi:bifunctional DNA-formamidopyrimidine glycosylase/DNA-(apurinic or apyrimidinic site) lyase [Candidatus Mesenet endosymbiont of Agriotes lineatus]|uniref:bifunctional DNA-formamidopyrimidine glycosylase/DNA-(apurinic or apyrimidinic site) lyase n=1 Tax=Candidatus Mesenet endosymbiont of Agriotes lineatus TaxID=3077948 RepID=UPI0030CF5C52